MDLRQIDVLVHQHVMQVDLTGFDWPTGFRDRMVRETRDGDRIRVEWIDIPRYSSDIAAAMQVWHALRAQGVYLDVETYADFYAVVARHESGVELAYEEHPSLPRAITEVALLVKGVEVPEDA